MLMLEARAGLGGCCDRWAHDDECDLSPAVSSVARRTLVENQDEHAVLLEVGAGQQGSDVGLEPCVRLGQSAIMGVMQHVGNNESKPRKLVIRQISREMREGHQVQL